MLQTLEQAKAAAVWIGAQGYGIHSKGASESGGWRYYCTHFNKVCDGDGDAYHVKGCKWKLNIKPVYLNGTRGNAATRATELMGFKLCPDDLCKHHHPFERRIKEEPQTLPSTPYLPTYNHMSMYTPDFEYPYAYGYSSQSQTMPISVTVGAALAVPSTWERIAAALSNNNRLPWDNEVKSVGDAEQLQSELVVYYGKLTKQLLSNRLRQRHGQINFSNLKQSAELAKEVDGMRRQSIGNVASLRAMFERMTVTDVCGRVILLLCSRTIRQYHGRRCC